MSIHVIVLAAGEGKRMMSSVPKVAHTAAGRPLIGWVLEAIKPLRPASVVAVVGHGSDEVTPHLPDSVITAVQEDQLGTGHAASVGLEAILSLGEDDTVLVVNGDMPKMSTGLLTRLADRPPHVAARLVTAELDNPTGYGRVIRSPDGAVVAIVEEKDCTDEQRAIREVNAGAYAFAASGLAETLNRVSNDNAQGEYYVTDVIGILVNSGERVEPVTTSPEEVVGINSQDQLAEARRLLQEQVNQRLMESGVWIVDPDTTYIDDTAVVEPGVKIYPGVHIEGESRVGAGTRLGPDVMIQDSVIGQSCLVWYSVVRGAEVGDQCEIGPYASVRPGTVLGQGVKAGTFVELKNARLGEKTKVPHLTYLGDATVGHHCNIGAGTITCNYNGVDKNSTEIGDEVFVGSDTMLIAPVRVGDRATTAAGSVISEDVSDGALAIERSEQREIPGYADKREARRAAKRDAEG